MRSSSLRFHSFGPVMRRAFGAVSGVARGLDTSRFQQCFPIGEAGAVLYEIVRIPPGLPYGTGLSAHVLDLAGLDIFRQLNPGGRFPHVNAYVNVTVGDALELSNVVCADVLYVVAYPLEHRAIDVRQDILDGVVDERDLDRLPGLRPLRFLSVGRRGVQEQGSRAGEHAVQQRLDWGRHAFLLEVGGVVYLIGRLRLTPFDA